MGVTSGGIVESLDVKGLAVARNPRLEFEAGNKLVGGGHNVGVVWCGVVWC